MFTELGIKRTSDWAKEGGFIGVGVETPEVVEPLWTDQQLGVDKVVKEMKAGAGPVGIMEALLERETKATAQAASAAA